VVVSGTAKQKHLELEGEAINVVDWISKPIDQSQLSLAIKQAMRNVSGTCSSTNIPKVLHVEDDPDVCEVVNAIVGDFAEMDHASTVADAWQKLEHNYYDLVILDLSLSDGSGLMLLPLLNNATPPIPVMVFSAQEIGQIDVGEIQSVLVKSRTDNAQLLATIKRLIKIE
jgi:CheY-like chemotaxis protein